MDGLRIAAGAIGVAGTSLDVTANNLANVSTDGFKSGSVHNSTGPGGRGVEVGAIAENTSPGPVSFTGRPLDLAIEGDGYFSVRTSGGRLAFTRSGSFMLDGAGRIATPNGDLLDPSITVPRDATGVAIDRDGNVTATRADGSSSSLGRIQPVRFSNPEGLAAIGNNLSVPTPNSGPGQRMQTAGLVAGGVELSNVDVAKEMVNLIRNERFTQVNAAVVRTEDENLGTLLDIKR